MTEFVDPKESGVGSTVPRPEPSPLKTEPLGLAAMIVGIIALPLSCCCGIFSAPLGLTAIVLGFLSKKKHKTEPQIWKGEGFALAGMILGSLSLVFAAIMMAIGIMGAVMDPEGLKATQKLIEQAAQKK